MKDIKLNNSLKRFWYFITWVFFILFGAIIFHLIAIGLYTYGKNTIENKEKIKGTLNMTYQKFIFIFGSIVGIIFLLSSIFYLIKDLPKTSSIIFAIVLILIFIIWLIGKIKGVNLFKKMVDWFYQ